MAALTSSQSEKKVLNPSSVLSTDKKHVAKRSRASSTEKNKSFNTSQTTNVAEGTDDIFRTHICSECRRCFKTSSHLKEHMRLHFPDPSLQCPTCKHFFTSKSKLRVHMLRETGQKLHQCHLCDYGAVERNPLLRHLASVHGHQEDGAPDRELFKCPSCPKEFSQSKALKSHMKSHNKTKDGQSLLCFQKNCSFECTDKKTFQKHTIDAHLIKAVECRHHACCSFFGSFEDMETHFRTHQAYHCQHCDFSCSNKNRLQQHMRQGHPGKKELNCSFCSFSTLNPVEFDQHVGHFHANEKTHCCTQCGFETAHKRVLKRHMLKHLGEKPHKCPQCDFRCRDETYLSKHMLTHSNVKQHMCSECGYVTKWKHYLTIHMRKHAGDLRYSCTQCPYRCHRIDQLNSHKLRHQEKSLICEVCAYSCKRKTELRNHMRLKHSTNADQQPPVHHCKFCPYTTKNRQALRTHENCKHTRARVFRCALCRYTTFSNTGLFLHKKKAHGYVPGDVKWVEMYAAKEREQSSSNLTPNFYSNPAEHQTASEHRTAIYRTQQPHTVDVSQISINQNQCETISEIVGGSKESNPQDHANTESPVKEAPLTKVDQASPALAWYCSPGGQVKALIRNNNHSSIQTLDDHNTVSDNESVTEDSVEEEEMLPSNTVSQPSSSDFQLQLMRRQDKDQAEALILEGKVQMLIVQTQAKTFHCDLCSYVTKKHEALLRHCKSSCRAMKASLRCRDCGMQFKQQRSLHTHRLKKCKKLSETMGRCRPSRTIEGSRVEDNELGMSRKQDSTGLDGPASLGSAEDECDSLTRSEGRLGTQGTSDSNALDEMFDHTDGGGCSGGNRSFSSTREGTMDQNCADSHTSIQSTATIAHDASNDSGQDSTRDPNHKVSKDHEAKSCLKPAEKPNDKCSAVTKSERSLRRCTRLQTKEKNFKSRNLQCDLCSFTCNQERSLTQHVAVKHNGVLPHQCRFCSFATTRRYQLEAHESGHTGIGRHCCELCDQTFGTRSRLRLHHQRIHDKQPTHFCSLCDYSAYSLNDISRHNLKCHTGEVHHHCDKCSAHFSTQTALKHHRGRAHPEDQGTVCTLPETHQGAESDPVKDTPEKQIRTSTTHHCKICSFTTNKKLLLVQHVMDEHENGQQEPSLKCDICGFSCAHQVVFNQHVRSHGGTCVFKCTECAFTTRNKQKITWHIRIHTGEKPYRCEKCDYACVDPSRLKYHMRIHTEERKYLCPECGFKCKWVNQLKHHMMKHTGAKPYSCGDCEYRTTRADALRIHVETRHREVRSFICEQCGKAFKLRFLLKMHQRKHSEERPYVCSICNSAFRWPAGLRNHHLNHTNQLPFHCRHCPYRARQKFQVVKHLKKYHPDVPVEDGVDKEQLEAAQQVWTGEEQHHGDGEAALENLQAS